MASHGRAKSLPPLEDPNPFWSEKVVEELHLRKSRPRDLPPVPDGSVESKSESRSNSARRGALGDGKGIGGGEKVFSSKPRVRSRSHGRSTGRGSQMGSRCDPSSASFRTPMAPKSWMHQSGKGGSGDDYIHGSVERELERQMFEHFRDENLKLKTELDEMRRNQEKSDQSNGSWSAIEETGGKGRMSTPPPPPRRMHTEDVQERRWTPNGTQVPLGSPPRGVELDDAEVDLLRWQQHYEKAELDRQLRWLGPEPPRILSDVVHGGGMMSRQAHLERGMRSRTEQEEQAEAWRKPRPEWLDEEAQRLRLERMLADRYGSTERFQQYWSTPMSYEAGGGRPDGNGASGQSTNRVQAEDRGAPQGRAYGMDSNVRLFQGNHKGVPLSRACAAWGRFYGEDCGVPLSRAYDGQPQEEHPGQPEGEVGWMRYHEEEVGHHQHPGRPEGDLPGPKAGGRSPSENERTKRALQEEIASLKQRLEESEKRGNQETKKDTEDRTRSYRDFVEHTLKSVPVVLPKLAEPGGKNSSLEAGDWLAQVRPYIADVGQGAEQWWDRTITMVMNQYGRWLEANPLERVHIKAPEMDQSGPGSDRLNQRVTTLLLSAVPESIKTELITTRQLSVSGVLFAILRRYQPGGLAEKTYTLSELTTTSPATTASQAVQRLRHWKRQQTRAGELGLTLPDPLIMVKALDSIMVDLWNQHPQASFRVSAFRMHQQIDVRPTMESLENLYDLLLAEADQMVYGKAGEVGEKDQKPSVKMLQQQAVRSPTQPSTVKVCGFWGTEKGCKLGRACRYLHDWNGIEDKASRCWLCSSTSHVRTECPTRGAGGSGSYGDRGEREDGKGKGKDGKEGGKDAGKGKAWKGSEGKDGGKDGKGKWKGPQVNKVTGQPGEPSAQKDQKPADQGQGQSTPERTQPEVGRAPSETADTSTKGLVDEVTSLLKSMRVAQSGGGRPALSAIKLRKMEAGRQTTVLLDGGATNCLRRARSDQEYRDAEPVQVSLASGSVSMRQSPTSRTLLVQEEVQPIVPLSDLINIGVSIEWNDRGCKMKHAGRILPIFLDEGCPVIGLTEGLDLMRQVEDFHERRAKLRLAVARVAGGEELPAGHDLEEAEAVNFAEDFPEVPPRLIERVPGKVRWDPALVPMNRRLRKRIQKARTVVIHLYSGTETSLWDTHGEDDMLVLNIELKRGMDMHNDHLFGFLEQLCQSGRVRGVYAGPPCRTVSLLRFQQEEGGPRPLRSRDGIHRFGLPWLTAKEQAEADGDAVLWLRTLQLMTVALEESVECAVALEQPEDPARWKEDDPELHGGWGYPSFMSWTETRQFAERFNLEFVHFDQKVLGHIRKKPTTMLTNMVTLRELQGRRDTTPDPPWPTTLKERMKESARLAEWAPAMQILMIREAKHLHRRYEQRMAARREDRQHSRATQRSSWTLRSDRHLQRLMALSTKEQIELADWQYHINNGHVPFRRDCYQCQESQGRDRQRRRVETPQGYTLNFDISGPYEAGFDQRQGRYKYFLAASFSVPSRGSTPLAEGLRCCGGGNIVHSDVELGSDLDSRLQRIENIEDMEEIFGASPSAPEEEYLVAGEEEREALTEMEVKEIEVANAKWKELVEGMKDVEMKFLTFAVPLTSRHGSEITRALSLIYVRLRSMNLPVVRCHSDRAKEFISRGVQQWMLNRDILHTFSAGDEAAGCGQIENLVNVLKGRSRVLMKAAKCERSLWPLAVRFAAEQRMREALSTMGIRLPVLIPFGASASAKVKRWHRRQGDDGWNGPYRQVRVWGPAFDMSPTSHGYFIEADGHWMRSTVIVRGQAPPPQLDLQLPESGEPPRPEVDDDAAPSIAPDEEFLTVGQEQEEREQEVELWEEGSEHADPQLHGPDPPRRRLTGKQHVPLGSNGVRPILRALRIGGEWSWELDLAGEQSEEQDKFESKVSVKRLQSERALLTLQHREAQQWLLEEKSLSDYENVGEVTMAIQEEIKVMEQRLKKMEALEAKAVEKECLITRAVDLAEVRQDLEGWREAISKEYESLLQHKAIQPVGGAEFEELKNSNKQLEIIPAKLVATVKPPNRRKARVVGCGNQAQWVEEDVTTPLQ